MSGSVGVLLSGPGFTLTVLPACLLAAWASAQRASYQDDSCPLHPFALLSLSDCLVLVDFLLLVPRWAWILSPSSTGMDLQLSGEKRGQGEL